MYDDDDLLNNDGSMFYGATEPALSPMYSALSSGDTFRHYQEENNLEEMNAGLSWGERIEAGYTGLRHGISSYGPEQLYRALRTVGKVFGSDDLQQFASEGIEYEQRLRELDPFYQVPDDWMTDGWGRSLYEGFRGISSSAYGMLPGAAVSLIPGAQGLGLAMLGAGAGSIAGLAEYDSFMDEAYEKFSALNPELTRRDIEDSHFWDAVWSGVSEGGVEAVSDIVGGKLIGLAGKAGAPAAKHIIDKLVRNVSKTMLVEAGGEVTTAMIQDYIRENAGLDYVGRVQALKSSLGPALVGGAVFGLGGTALSLAQGKLNGDGPAKSEAEYRADLDAQTLELQRQFREAHYTPKAVEVFNKAMEDGGDYFKSIGLMETVENAARAWSERTGGTLQDWQGDSAKLADMLKRLEDRRINPEGTLAESLESVRDYIISELTMEQRQQLADVYGIEVNPNAEGNQDVVTFDSARLDSDLRQLLGDPKHIENIAETVRPVLDSMRDGVLDLYGLANRQGLAGGFDPELSQAMGRAIEIRNANKPKAPAFIVQEADLEAVRQKHGDFSRLDAKQQSAMLKDLAKATNINFDTWDLPTDQKAMLAFVDGEMKPLLDKMLNRGKRSDAKQEGLAKAALEADGVNLERFAEFTAQLTGNGDIRQSAAVKARELQLAERIFLEKATELGTIANQTLAPSDILKWQMAGAMHQQVHSMLRAVRSESGHLLRAWNYIKKDPDLKRAREAQLYDAMGGLEAARHKLTAFTNAMTDADRASVLGDSLKAKTVNMFVEYRTLNLLSSPKTHIVNVSGNAGTLVTEAWNRFLGEKMGKGQGIVRGETWELVKGMWEGLINVRNTWRTHRAESGGTMAGLRNINAMWENSPAASIIGDVGMMEPSLTRQNAQDVIGGIKEKVGLSREHGIISNGLSGMVEYMGRMLGISGDVLLAQDQLFKTIASHGELRAQIHRAALEQSGGDRAKYKALKEQFTKRPLAEHKLAAMEFGKLVTFQSDLQGFAKSLDSIRQKHPLTRTLIPFFKTPVNIMKYAAAHTPGLASLFGDIRNQLNSPDLATRHLAEARVMTGTLVWATAIGLAASGYLTGSGPTDDNEREKARAAGWQPNSLKLPGQDGQPDTYVALDRLDPAAFILNTAASLVEIYDSMDDDDLQKAMWGGFAAAFRVASDRTYLRSLSDAVAAVSDWEGYEGRRARQGLATSMVPASSAMRMVAQQLDPVQREVQGVYDAILAGIPGMSMTLPQRRNFLGEAVTSDGYYGSNWLSPLRQSMDKQDPVYDEIYRLARAGFKIPSMPDRHIRHQGNSVKMSPAQYSAFMELAGVGLRYGGKTAKDKIAEVIASRAYKSWGDDDEKKADQITAIIQSYRKEARKQVRLNDPDMRRLMGME